VRGPAREPHSSVVPRPSEPPAARRQSLEPPRPAPIEPSHDAEPAAPAAAGTSWAAWFSGKQRTEITALEQELGARDFRAAVLRCESLSAELLADAAEQTGLDVEDRRPLLIALSLGLPAQRWSELRRTARAARSGTELTELDALEAYGTLIELQRLQRRLAAEGR
jgi:hypothetical protein